MRTVHPRHSQKRIFDAYRCAAGLLSCDNKRFARIALRRIGILSLTRPAAGGESCFAGFFLLIKWRSIRALLCADFRASTKSAYRSARVNCNENIDIVVFFL